MLNLSWVFSHLLIFVNFVKKQQVLLSFLVVAATGDFSNEY